MPQPMERRSPPRLVVWWERLPLGIQIGCVLPVTVIGLAVLHMTALGQPFGRGVGYGIFWGVIAAFGIVGASRSERAKREARQHAEHPDGDPRRRRL